MAPCSASRLRFISSLLALALLWPGVAIGHETVESACRTLILDYAIYRDRHDADAVSALFAEDATLEVMGQRFTGREAIRQRFVAARGGPVTRHMMSTIRIERLDASHARGISYVTIYQGPAPDGTADVVAPDLRIVGEYHDAFEKTDDGWKIIERRFRPVLQPAGP